MVEQACDPALLGKAVEDTATPRLQPRPPPHPTLRNYLRNGTRPSALPWQRPCAGLSPAFPTLAAELRGRCCKASQHHRLPSRIGCLSNPGTSEHKPGSERGRHTALLVLHSRELAGLPHTTHCPSHCPLPHASSA